MHLLYNTTSDCNMHCDDYSMSVSVCKNGRYYCTVFRHVFGQIPLASFGCVSFNADKVNTIITGLVAVLKETAEQPPQATLTPPPHFFFFPLWHHMASMAKCSPSARKMLFDVQLEFWLSMHAQAMPSSRKGMFLAGLDCLQLFLEGFASATQISLAVKGLRQRSGLQRSCLSLMFNNL